MILQLVSGVCLLLASTAAHAEDRSVGEVEEQARAYFQASAYALAAREFAMAYDMSPKPNHLFNAARAYEMAGDGKNASVFYGR